MSFGDSVKAHGRKVTRSLNKIARGVELRLFRAVILDTPVGDPKQWKNPPPPGYVGGRLRGNWQITTGSPAQGELPNIDPRGAETVMAVVTFLDALKGGNVTFLTNNLPYAERVEYGWSGQAPEGMMRKNVARFDGLVQAEARIYRV